MWSFFYLWRWRRETWRAFWRQPGISSAIGLNLIILAANWLVVLYGMPSTGEFSIIRYSVPLGPNWVDDANWLKLIPALSTLFTAVNLALAYAIGRRTLLLKQLWLWSSFCLNLGWLWLGLLLLWINS